MEDNIVNFPKGRGTVGRLVQQLMDNEDEIESIVVVVQKKNGKVMPTWSDQNTMQLAFSSRVLDWEVDQQLSTNHE